MSEKKLYSHEEERRAKLRASKPLVYEKIMRYQEKLARGESTAVIDFAYDFKCNLHCKHCSAAKMVKKDRVMTVDDVHNMAVQADEYGLAQFNISGGEPLLFAELDEIIKALMPERFYLGMSTNGMFLDLERAKHLKELGLDKMRISLDSFDEAAHEDNRNKKGSYQKAIDALKAGKEAGMQVYIQHVISHQTAKSKELVELCEFAEKNGYAIDILIARALGEWEGRDDVLIDEEDAAAIRALHDRFPFFLRDVFPHYGVVQGCGAVNHILHVTKYGDVLPCVFIQIAIGNLFEEPLKDIINRGFNIKHFREFNPVCLSGEDKNFIDKYMKKCYGKPVPADYRDIFTDEDYIDPSIM
ncbi:MAG: radical SAM protein [Lachnospiraceae bacterium]|jgi:MoaA/NifB/PqqE/SkfB family radical SAM enzyme|nr:radical SAM protein [Lachnospiraceae bacterium]